MPPLTRAEASARFHRLRVRRVSVDLDVRTTDSFTSTTTIEFTDALPGEQTFVDFHPTRLLRAELNGAPLDPDLLVDGRLPILPAADNVLVLSGEMAYSNDGEGLHRHVDPADERAYLYAMSFLDAGPRWFASFDQPDLKAPYVMRVHTPLDWTVLGNGRFTEVEPGEWESVETPPLASYFVTVVAGPYASTFDEHDGIHLGVHARASLAAELAAEADDVLAVTKQAFDAFHEMFGLRYAFGDYHQVFVPDFNAGAMENPGCVTFRDAYLFRGAATRAERAARAGTVVHELAHQWFGDLVTMRWWDDLWLNESFAEFVAHAVCAEHTPYPLWVDFALNRKDWGAIADQGPTTHPIAGNGAQDTEEALAQFDGISYAKGAGVLKQLVANIGPDVFNAGLRDYFDRHRFGNAEFSDLRAALERAGAGDLGPWSEAWLQTAGMDTITVESLAEGARVRRIPGAAGGDRVHAVRLAAYARDGVELERRTGTVPAVGEWALDGLPPAALLVPDAADETWARIRADRPVEQWPGISKLADPLTRVVLWNSVRDQVRSAELDPEIALATLCDQLPSEPEDLIARALLDWGQAALAGPYALPADRQRRLCHLADAALTILAAAQAGSDLQLSAWRALMGCTDDQDALQGWLDGTSLPAGRELDAELRWRATTRLASINGNRALIDQAYELDRSTAGRIHRVRALAALPDPEAKAEAFQQLMNPSDLSAYEVYAIAEGFFLPEQSELTEEFVQRFFREINATAAFRSGWALGQVVLRAFPAAANSRTTLELAEELLASGDLAPGVRRPLLEATDLLRRAVESVEKFGHGPRHACGDRG
ncbi:aminopeptidase N [Granulicoccus sp. GXG6511]|uniref:aminopeptidase N n=1 Tax=Granulicoccus sp. GXG6511 TaxID=3381351 RepID=UPI003D7D9753